MIARILPIALVSYMTRKTTENVRNQHEQKIRSFQGMVVAPILRIVSGHWPDFDTQTFRFPEHNLE